MSPPEREKAHIGIFISLAEPTRDMITEAASVGLYTTENRTYPHLQLFTIADILYGKLPRIPFNYSEGYKRAAREEEEKQELLI